MINDIKVYENGGYVGLALILIQRSNFAIKEISLYDTHSKKDSTIRTVDKTFYAYNADGSVRKITQEVKQLTSDNYSAATDLYNKMLSLEEDKIVILVSCYGWERYFTTELADLLAKYGALNILELKGFLINNDLDSKINNKNVLNKHFYYHPFAFIGIPNIGPGNGYESLRTNKGHYLSTDNLPYAELLVKFKYNKYARNYYYDARQYYPRYNYKDDFDYLFKAQDYSLSNVIPLLVYKNMTTPSNTGFSIYDKTNNKEFEFPFSGVYETELDRVVFGEGVGAKRYSLNGTLIQDGISLNETSYYEYFNSHVRNNAECTNASQACPNGHLLQLNNPILQCKIGLTPHICSDNANYQYLFPGYK
jgi:hypothetical protein